MLKNKEAACIIGPMVMAQAVYGLDQTDYEWGQAWLIGLLQRAAISQ